MFDSYVNHYTLRTQRPAVETVMDISPRFKPPNGMALGNGEIQKFTFCFFLFFFHTHLMATTQITGRGRGVRESRKSLNNG